MEKDFLIKYTILANNIDRLSVNKKEGIKGYLVSPCYLISGNEVVLPFDINSSELVKPLFNEDSKCINSVFVNDVFDNYEDALRYANSLNGLIKAKYTIYAYKEYYKESYDLYYKELNELTIKHNSNMRECKNIERNIFSLCKDIVTLDKKEEVVRKKKFSFINVRRKNE